MSRLFSHLGEPYFAQLNTGSLSPYFAQLNTGSLSPYFAQLNTGFLSPYFAQLNTGFLPSVSSLIGRRGFRFHFAFLLARRGVCNR